MRQETEEKELQVESNKINEYKKIKLTSYQLSIRAAAFLAYQNYTSSWVLRLWSVQCWSSGLTCYFHQSVCQINMQSLRLVLTHFFYYHKSKIFYSEKYAFSISPFFLKSQLTQLQKTHIFVFLNFTFTWTNAAHSFSFLCSFFFPQNAGWWRDPTKLHVVQRVLVRSSAASLLLNRVSPLSSDLHCNTSCLKYSRNWPLLVQNK